MVVEEEALVQIMAQPEGNKEEEGERHEIWPANSQAQPGVLHVGNMESRVMFGWNNKDSSLAKPGLTMTMKGKK